MLFSEMIKKAGNNISPINIKFDFEVNKLCYNSNSVKENDVFFAIKGLKTDGNQFIDQALKNGARAVFSDSLSPGSGMPVYKIDDCRKTMALLSNVFYDFPSSKMNMLGVTGTNGKTTVTALINYVLEFAGKGTGLIGTNNYVINKKILESTHTTPESVDLNALLYTMNRENVQYVTMEVSSHSLALNRVYGLDFDTAVFTNLTPEHLDFHPNMEEYFRAKKILFDTMERINSKDHLTHAVYNADDKYGKQIIKDTQSEKISYGFGDADYKAGNLSMSFEKMNFDVEVNLYKNKLSSLYERGVKGVSDNENRTINITTKLTGRFNAYNILASVAALRTFDIPYDTIITAIENFPPVDGRFNVIKLRNGALAVIDYSHTPDSLYNALLTIKEILGTGQGKITTVFGCGGNRDQTKRPVMGEIAAKNSDFVIITSDNPRYEEPLSIIADIESGITSDNYIVEPDRRIAIEKAVEQSKSGDVVLIAGKGHETYQEIKGVKHHLSDREIVEKFC